MANVYAYTDSEPCYPSYVSVNESPDGLRISVRGARKEDGAEGGYGDIVLTRARVGELLIALLCYLVRHR